MVFNSCIYFKILFSLLHQFIHRSTPERMKVVTFATINVSSDILRRDGPQCPDEGSAAQDVRQFPALRPHPSTFPSPGSRQMATSSYQMRKSFGRASLLVLLQLLFAVTLFLNKVMKFPFVSAAPLELHLPTTSKTKAKR